LGEERFLMYGLVVDPETGLDAAALAKRLRIEV